MIAHVVRAIVWPVVILVLVLVFRRQLVALCTTLERLREGDWEAEWHLPGNGQSTRADPAALQGAATCVVAVGGGRRVT